MAGQQRVPLKLRRLACKRRYEVAVDWWRDELELARSHYWLFALMPAVIEQYGRGVGYVDFTTLRCYQMMLRMSITLLMLRETTLG